MRLSCGILIGGKSSRMGQDKAFLTLKGKTFLDTLAEELKGFDQVLVSVNDRDQFHKLTYELIEDYDKNIGPIEGMRQLLKHATSEYVFICATDTPFIKKELVEYLYEFISTDYDCFVLKDAERTHPLCAIYSKKVLPMIEKMIEQKDYKLLHILEKSSTKYINIEKSCYSAKLIANINTKEAYQQLSKPIVFCVSGVKNSGKTTLISKLIKAFNNDHMTVAVIKHDGHDFEIDHEHTDTFTYSEAGASQIAIYSAYKYAIIHHKRNNQLEEIIDKLEDSDVIIIEGEKYSSYPKIEIVRAGVSEESVCYENSLIAIATNLNGSSLEHLACTIKQTDIVELQDIKGVYIRIMNYFKKKII